MSEQNNQNPHQEWAANVNERVKNIQRAFADLRTLLIRSNNNNPIELAWIDQGLGKDGYRYAAIGVDLIQSVFDSKDSSVRYIEGETQIYLENLSDLLHGLIRLGSRQRNSPESKELLGKIRVLIELVNDTEIAILRYLAPVSPDHQTKAPRPRIPAQMSAPIKVSMVDHRLQINDSATFSGSIVPASFERLRLVFSENVRFAIQDLEHANTDKRLIEFLRTLVTYLSIDIGSFSPVALGFNYELLRDVLPKVREELPDLTLKRLEKTLLELPILLNQFEEWREYTNLRPVYLDWDELKNVVVVARELETELSHSDASDKVDPSIGDRLYMLIWPVAEGFSTSENVILALTASLTNIFAGLADAAMNFAFDAIDVIDNSRLAASLATSGASVLGLMAWGILKKHSPKLARIRQFSFVHQTVDYVAELLREAKR